MSIRIYELYEFEGFRLDVREHTLERIDGDKSGSLPDKAFQTLVVLVRNQGRLLTKSELLDAVWPETAVEENNLDKSIHAIRTALGEKPREQKFIETIRKHGYRFVADVRIVDAANGPELGNIAVAESDAIPFEALSVPTAQTEPERNEPPTTQQVRPRWSYWLVAVVVCFLAVLAIGGWFTAGNWRPGPAKSASVTDSAKESADGTTRSAAYDLYVRGKVKVASENREDTEAAIKVLEEAIAIDPNFAEAYAQLARGYNTMAFKYSSDLDRKRYYENAEVAIEKALALNPNLAEAHFARGLILWTNTKRFPHEQAIQSYKRSLTLDPNLDETHHQLSLVYSHIGLLDEAEQSVKKALEINPNNTLARFRAGVYIAYRGKSDDAIAVFKTVPTDFTPLIVDRSMAEALIQTGRLSEAEVLVDDYLSKYTQDEGGSFTSVKALLRAKAGKQKEAEEAIARAVEIGKGYGHFHHTAYNVASAYAAMNKPDEAVKWLEFAAENGFPNYRYFENDPNLQNIRNHGRFIEFMTKLELRWQRFKATG